MLINSPSGIQDKASLNLISTPRKHLARGRATIRLALIIFLAFIFLSGATEIGNGDGPIETTESESEMSHPSVNLVENSSNAAESVCDQIGQPLGKFKGHVQTPNGEDQNGLNPSIALANARRIVEVHQSENVIDLWYSVGIIQPDSSVVWKTNTRINVDDNDKRGVTPDVDITYVNTSPLVIQVNASEQTVFPPLWYNLGQLNEDNTITWYTNGKVEVDNQHKRGLDPKIAVDNDRVVQVNLSDINAKDIWFNTGRIRNNQIEWQRNGQVKNSQGTNPDVALMDDKVIVVFTTEFKEEDPTISYRLRYTNGTLKPDGTIIWENVNDNIGGQQGTNPTIAFGKDGTVIEIHTSPITSKIWANLGKLDWPNINWRHNCIWDPGIAIPGNPQVAYDPDENLIIDIHQTGIALWVNVGKINYDYVYLPVILP